MHYRVVPFKVSNGVTIEAMGSSKRRARHRLAEVRPKHEVKPTIPVSSLARLAQYGPPTNLKFTPHPID